MTISNIAIQEDAEKFLILIDWNVLAPEGLRAAKESAVARGLELETILIREYGVSRHKLAAALSEYYNCPFVEYDERMSVPPELLSGLDDERLTMSGWFPILKEGNTVIIAASNPQDPRVFEEVRSFIKADRYEFWVALEEDIQWFIQDFLHAKAGALIGTERTGLAYWRNTMAHWRTRLACYRNDLAKGRTDLAFFRWGLGFIALTDVLMRTGRPGMVHALYWLMAGAGLGLVFFGLHGYLSVRKTRMTSPDHQTLVEVTAATLHFLENYHFIEHTGIAPQERKKTMLARLGDFLVNFSTILYPSPASRERTHLARERNVLAAQRTVSACYRTIYARARTGLAFMRTGIAFVGVGLGLLHYFGLSLFTILDSLLIAAGLLMVLDGILWYLPVRKEQAEVPRCPV
jgi:uncharacterized membrane protein YidH (DUF202 family)